MDVQLNSHKAEVIRAFNDAKQIALEMIGIKGEKYAKALCPVGTPESTGIPGYIGGTLRKSISHEYDDDSAYIGTNVEYAPYQELGTMYMTAANEGRGFLRPAVKDHVNDYKNVVRNVLKNYIV